MFLCFFVWVGSVRWKPETEKMSTTKTAKVPCLKDFVALQKLPKTPEIIQMFADSKAPKEKQPRNTLPEVILRLMVQKSGKLTS